ncbi:MAG: lipase [Lachnospiraceae bacterium]|nr:lipase [Lachnospiraceae bacterium]
MFVKKLFNYPYLLFLTISFFIVIGAWKLDYLDFKDSAAFSDAESSTVISDLTEAQKTIVPESSSDETMVNETTTEENIEESPSEVSPFYEADRSYFDDALFIGDSRTVGLYEYGDLGNAIVLADSGMSVYKIFKQSFSVDSGKKMTLEELLTQKQFGKIYVMLGINELGYSFEQTVDVYKDMLTSIEALQPDALMFLQANLHITEKKSSTSPIYNNSNINRFNAEIEKITDSKKYFYLDANEMFDDENGNLSTEYTVDESHVLGKYYADWVDWILCHAVAPNVNNQI